MIRVNLKAMMDIPSESKMKTKLNHLKRIYTYLNNPDAECLKLSMSDTHRHGIFSLVIKGKEFGKLTRVFIASTELKPYEVQLHTHRYPINLTVIQGNIKHHTAIPTKEKVLDSVNLSQFNYKSPLNGGKGLSYSKELDVRINDYTLPVGCNLNLGTKDFHTMSCDKGSIWIVEEKGFEVEESKVLGVPFVLDDLYNEPKPFEINDNVQKVKRAIKKIILEYELV